MREIEDIIYDIEGVEALAELLRNQLLILDLELSEAIDAAWAEENNL